MRKKIIGLILAILILGVSGCQNNLPHVAYTVYPIEFLLQRLAKDRIVYQNISDDSLILRGSLIVDYQKILKKSDLLIYFGGLEPFMLSYNAEIEATKVQLLDITARTNIYQFNRYYKHALNNTDFIVKEGPYYDGAEFNSIDIYSNDPYLWMDPIALTSMAKQIKNWLTSIYPEQKKFFETNYEKLEIDLALLDYEFQNLKHRDTAIKLVTMTPSFGPWQQNYGVEVYPVILSKFGALPTEQQLTLIKERIKDDGVHYIADEPNLPTDIRELYEALIIELDLKPIKLSSVTFRTMQQVESNKDFIDIMYDNLLALESLE